MKIYNVYQSGKRLYIDEKENPDNKIVCNKYESEQTTLRLISDGTLPPHLYWALRNPNLSNEYFVLKLINNEDLIVGTDISATPGLYEMILIGTPDDYIIEGTDIDQSKLTYISDSFSRLFVRDNYLKELDFKEQCSPTFRVFYDEIMFQLDNKIDKKDITDEIYGDVIIDSTLSETSTNPVQNAVVTKEFNALKQRNAELEETIEKMQIKVITEESDYHHITDSAEYGVLDFGLSGITEQPSTEGKNWFDVNAHRTLVEGISVSGNMITISKSSGKIYYDLYLESGDYAISFSTVNYVAINISDSAGNVILNNSVSSATLKNSFTVSTGDTIIIMFDAGGFDESDTSLYRKISNIQIETGTTVTDYEPYTNGASPNPDYPQEITNAGVLNEETGRYEIGCHVGNRNLLVYNITNNNIFGIDFTVNDDMSVTMKGTNEQPNAGADLYFNKKLFLKSGTYRLSDGGVSISNNCFLAMHILGTSQYIYTNFYGTGTRGNIALDEDVYVEIYIRVGGGATIDAVMYPMLIYQGDDTTYIPHASQPITLTSPVPITKWDKLVKRDGVWGWSVYAKEYNVEIDKLYIYGNICTDTEVRLYCSNIISERNGECRVDILRYNTSENINCCGFWYNTYLCFRLLGANLEPYGYVYDASLSASNNCNNAATAFKAMLKDKGYETIHAWVDKQSEQAFYPLPDEEQTLLNNLETYYGVTNVYNEQGCPITLTYVADNKLYVDQQIAKQITQTQALILES